MRTGYKGTHELIQKHKERKCVRCGDEVKKLIYHHKNPKTRKFIIGDGATRAYKRVTKEIAKCVTVCVSCHPTIHAEIRKAAG